MCSEKEMNIALLRSFRVFWYRFYKHQVPAGPENYVGTTLLPATWDCSARSSLSSADKLSKCLRVPD